MIGRSARVATLICAFLSASAHAAQTKLCTLQDPQYTTGGDNVTFEISIDCEASGPKAKPLPLGPVLLVGLTVYAEPSEEDGGSSDQPTAASAVPKEQIKLTDALVDSHDFAVQKVKLGTDTKK